MAQPLKQANKVKAPVPREAEIVRLAKAVLESRGIRSWRRNVSGITKVKGGVIRHGEKGQSDRWGVLPDGRHLELELKRPGNRPTYEQVLWLIELNQIGRAVAFWVDNGATLELVLDAVLAGARIVYREDLRRYKRRDGSIVHGPSGDFDVIFPAKAGQGKPPC